MSTHTFETPAFQIGLSLVLGMISQIVARRLRVPGIVVLLAAGVLAGPEVTGLLRPAALGHGLADLVGFAVAIILFEGAVALDLPALWRHGLAIRRLVTIGVTVTALLTTLAAHWILGWSWSVAALFGTLMVVTGPTVVQPILRRIRVRPNVATVLEAEGILGDAVGATLAVVALEVVLAPAGDNFLHGVVGLASRFTFGGLLGLLAGGAITGVMRFERLVPAELRNVTALALLLGFYQTSNALRSDSGVLVAVVAGLVVANLPGHPLRKLREFKEELTALLIGLLFVVLAADVRLADLQALGPRGWMVVALLMLAIRPLNVLLSCRGTDLNAKERTFIAWLAPRGIVAAAVAAHFARGLDSASLEGGRELQALVFLVIATTVTVQGLSGGWVARRLGVALPEPTGWVILGANPLARCLGERLAGASELTFIDANPLACEAAAVAGYRAVCANALAEDTAEQAGLALARSFIALTANEEVNFLFARQIRENFPKARVWVALRRDHPSISVPLVTAIGARCLFDGERNLEQWSQRIAHGDVELSVWIPPVSKPRTAEAAVGRPHPDLLPLAVRRAKEVLPLASDWRPQEGDRVEILIQHERREEAQLILTEQGWQLCPNPAPPDPPGDQPANESQRTA